ncbi:hypothetical protein MKX03_028824 [Papaver bracteatum]|nr:hypothetical protein MKX03_028824 [Papaver bracteatum]
MKTEITSIFRPKGKVVERNFSLNVLSVILKGTNYLGHLLHRLNVCKLWKTILSNRRHKVGGLPFFACQEYDHIDCNRMNYYYSHETLMVMEHCIFVYKPYHILVGSCNGLVCLQKEDPSDQYLQEPFAICNPVTGESIYLKANLRANLNVMWECRSGSFKWVRLLSLNRRVQGC